MSGDPNKTGLVFNIQHFSVHDGPGIRTAVFLKGCPLRCRWCANPESQSFESELAWTEGQCISCGGCINGLKCVECHFDSSGLEWKDAVNISADEVKKVCPTGALHVIGEERTAGDIIDVVERDRVFYGDFGGLTITGGEPLSQPGFTSALIDESHRRNINCAIETSGFARWEILRDIAVKIDYYLTDIKCLDDKLHIDYTGVSNRLILENISRLVKELPQQIIHVRTPIIPGFNDNEHEIAGIAEYLNGLGGKNNLKWELLKYHRLGIPKYKSLKRSYEMNNAELGQEEFERLHKTAKKLFSNTL